MSDQKFFELNVIKKENNTPFAATFFMDIAQEEKGKFSYKPGQYITLKIAIDGEEHRRSYSLSSAPGESDFHFTVKKVKGGKVSPVLVNQVNKGNQLKISLPEGKFTMDFSPEKKRDHYFFAGGSGITPIFSLIKDALINEPKSTIYLLYCNKNEESIIFKNELEKLQEKHRDQFFVENTFTQTAKGLLSRFFSPKVEGEPIFKGRIDDEMMNTFLERHPQKRKEAHYFICGPGNMIQHIKSFLQSRDVPNESIHLEYFTTDAVEKKAINSGQDAIAEVFLNGAHIQIEIPANKNILEALQDAGYDPPYSCTSGVCSSCMAKLEKGEVEMETCLALDDSEVEEGFILTCQAKPVSSEIKLTYDV